MFDGTETAALLIWEVNPYISSLGNGVVNLAKFPCQIPIDNGVTYDIICDVMKILLDTNIIVAGLYKLEG